MRLLLFALTLLSLFLKAVGQTCHYSCSTCSGTLSTDCTSCIDGLYLSGSVCVVACDVLTDPSTKTCLYGCPTYYFQRGTVCELCPQNCKHCSSAEECNQWQDGYDPDNIILDLMPLWITSGVVFLALVSLLIWRLCIGKNKPAPPPPPAPKQQERSSAKLEENMEPNWIQDVDNLHMSVNRGFAKRRSSDVIEGIGNK